MNCPQCDSDQTMVIDSRPLGKWSRRRRKCSSCGLRFNTIEVTEEMVKDCFKKLKLLQQVADLAKEAIKGKENG